MSQKHNYELDPKYRDFGICVCGKPSSDNSHNFPVGLEQMYSVAKYALDALLTLKPDHLWGCHLMNANPPTKGCDCGQVKRSEAVRILKDALETE